MQRWKNSLLNACFALNCLLVFLLVFEKKFSVPPLLQVGGRMHPMVLHFPLALVVLYAVAVVILPPRKTSIDDSYRNTTDFLLLLAAFTSVITALMGLFLSKEEGYDPQALQWHKWSGIAVPIFTLLWYSFSKPIQSKKITSVLSSSIALFIILLTGHLGAEITHGENSLLAPIMPDKQPAVSADQAIVFTNMVKPILEAKCAGCHNNKKAKGELVMQTEALLLKGGKNGKLWDTTAADLGLLLRRVHLPIAQKEHMPPQGKAQLREQEIEIITQWIGKGADFQLRVADLAVADTLRQIADKIFAPAHTTEYSFAEADASVIKKLNTVNRVVSAEALGSPALSVSFFNSTLFHADQLKDLGKIKKQIVSLDLAKMPLKDDDIKIIGEFENLKRLNLSFTGISGAGLAALKKLKFLKSLSLSGTKLRAAQLEQLKNFAQLETVYTWNTGIAATDIEKLRQKIKTIRFETGFNGDTMILKLSPPVLLNEEAFITTAIPLQLKHYIQGATIRYTLDGSEPDSLHSPVFKGNETIENTVVIRAKAYKPGWMSSDVLEAAFYKNTYTPHSVVYLSQPDSGHRDDKGKILIDREKQEANFLLGNWVAFRENKMECLLQFLSPVAVQNITLNALIETTHDIMPAQWIEIWGGHDAKNMKRLSRLTPQQPTMHKKPFIRIFDFKFKPATVNYIKIVAAPTLLPAWHSRKGTRAWMFIDEVLVN